MATPIEMPKLSDTMTEGTLVKWHKSEGDTVEVGDILADIETDKATMEMEAFDDGILGKIYVQEGEKAPLGAQLAMLVEEGEEAPDTAGAAPAAAAPEAEEEPKAEAKAAAPAPADSPEPAAAAPAVVNTGRVKASPLAKKIAEKEGIDLATVKGTGPGGRVVKADLENAPKGGAVAAVATGAVAAAVAAPAAIMATASGEDQKIPMSGMRSVIAERLLASKTQIPHFYLHIEVDAKPIMSLRKQLNAALETNPEANKYTVNDFVLKAVVAAAVEVPQINSSFAGDHVIQFANVDLCVAVAIDDGLVTPVVRDAGKKSILAISKEVKDLASRARNKKLKPAEMTGGSITVSNLGSYGIDSFDAIINPPQAAILAIGGASEKPVVKDGQIVPGLRMDVGLSCDHRVVDGAVGATYLAALKKYLEQPALMLV